MKIQSLQKVSTSTFNFNLDNPAMIQKIRDYCWAGKNFDYQYESCAFERELRQFNHSLNDAVFNGNINMTHKSMYVSYYLIRGWDIIEARQKISDLYNVTEIFCSIDDIRHYICTNNSFDININNEEYFNKLLE